MNFGNRVLVLVVPVFGDPEAAADALEMIAGAQHDVHAALHGADRLRRRHHRRVDVLVEQCADALGVARQRKHLVVAAKLHLEVTREHGGALVVIGRAGPGEADRLASEIFRLGDLRPRHEHVLRGERLVDHVLELGAALEHGLRTTGRDRHEVHVARHAGTDHRRTGELDETRVETLVLVVALVHRDVGRQVKPDAANDLADRDFGLRSRARRNDDTRHRGKRRRTKHPHGTPSLEFFSADRALCAA